MLYMARCILEMKSPLHCGANSDGFTSGVVTDAYGLWRIPGTSVAGVLRFWLRRQMGVEIENALFGQERTVEDRSSLVDVSDAVLLDFDQTFAWEKLAKGTPVELTPRSFIRDRISLDFKTGTVVRGQRFNEEYVPAGTRFALELSLNDWDGEIDAKLVEAFSALILALKAGQISFGGRLGSGYGATAVIAMECRQCDPRDPKQMEEWLNLSHAPLFPKKVGSEWTPEASLCPPASDTISGSFTLPLLTSGPILIAGGMPVGEMDADLCFASTACCDYEQKTVSQYLVVPGSSLRGVVRHRVYHILETIGCEYPDKEVADLFGGTGQVVKRGRLSFLDSPLYIAQKKAMPENCQTVQHVTIDRLTGEVVDAHLFNESPLWRKNVFFSVTIRLHDVLPWQAGILLHAFLDLAQGNLHVGNGFGRGNGMVELDRSRPLNCQLTWNGETLEAGDRALAETWLRKISQACKEKGYAAAV